jgi:hypothetical protein
MLRTKPRFRADYAVSLLRPAALEEARAMGVCGEIAADAISASGEKRVGVERRAD